MNMTNTRRQQQQKTIHLFTFTDYIHTYEIHKANPNRQIESILIYAQKHCVQHHLQTTTTTTATKYMKEMMKKNQLFYASETHIFKNQTLKLILNKLKSI